MFKNYHIHALVLKRRNVFETDKILTLFTRRFGKISVIAKGIRKIHSKKAPHLEVFSHVALYLATGKSLDIIIEAQTLHSFSFMRGSIDKIAYAYRLVEQIDRLCPERQPHEVVYTLLLHSLEKLNTIALVNIDEVTDRFTYTLLQQLGYLSHEQKVAGNDLDRYLEQIMETKLASNHLLSKIST